MHKEEVATVQTSIYKKYRPMIYFLIIIGALIAFKNVILQLLLITFTVLCIGFLLFKGITYMLKIGYFLVRGILCSFAFIFTMGGILWVLNLLN